MDYLYLSESRKAHFQYWWWNFLIFPCNLYIYSYLYFYTSFNGLCLYKIFRTTIRRKIWRKMGNYLWISKFAKKGCFILLGLLLYSKSGLLYYRFFYLITSNTDHFIILLKHILYDLLSLCKALHLKTW